MDDSGHRENGRHNPLQRPWHMQHQPSIGQIMAAMAERDAALQERNLAFSEKKAALAERDLAILQRNSAILERNSAIMARDKAITTLQNRKNAMTLGVKHEHQPHHYRPQTDETPYNSSDIHVSGPLKMSPVPLETKKQTKEAKTATHNKKPSKISKRVKREKGEDEMGLNQVGFHGTTMPVPVCSCTGILRSCYKWGNGGWQSSCCTTAVSMYPLPAVPHKRHARVGGRKMSGSAFNKLLSRLAAEGHDLSSPVDLKNNWAKHGTNRYITIK
ncbi:hypothetical protein RHSIM_Rhsim07G0245500 [Rhododendron simsii]|uniref:GAGA-binding transcriptional activator n=1 Tax=Rhododendron simsii TaxID=118357 RepID=A0A834GRD7_RHOSS|nr:hypothetical protein RHSIM_Rhsim07G0245500 [Rhododendron simsii]